jgi:hypothetical protein
LPANYLNSITLTNTKFSNSDNKPVDEKDRKEFFKKIFTLIILIAGAMDGKFSF